MRRYLNLARHTSDYKVCCSRALFVNIAVYLGYAPNAGWPSRAGQHCRKQRHPSRSTSGENRPSIRISPLNGGHAHLKVLGPSSGAFLRSIPSLVNGKNLIGVISLPRIEPMYESPKIIGQSLAPGNLNDGAFIWPSMIHGARAALTGSECGACAD